MSHHDQSLRRIGEPGGVRRRRTARLNTALEDTMVRRALVGVAIAIAVAGSAQANNAATFSLVAASFKNAGGNYDFMPQMKKELDLRGVPYTDRQLLEIARGCEAKAKSLGTRARPQTITCADDEVAFQIRLID
jgi:hypothetical protein